MGIFRIPGQLYDYVYGTFGWFGVAVGALLLILGAIGVFVWFDRRR